MIRIVPELCSELLTRYGSQIEDLLSEEVIHAAGNATSYREMVEQLLLPLLGSGGGEEGGGKGTFQQQSYEDFQKGATSSNNERQQIDKPTLMLCALDDPLHCCDRIGIDTDLTIPDNVGFGEKRVVGVGVVWS